MTPAARAWLALWSGRYRVVSVTDRRGVRTLHLEPTKSPLSPRQAEVARAVACGFALVDVQAATGLSGSTVATYAAQAAAKLGLDGAGLRFLLPGSVLPDPLSLDATLDGPLPCPCPRGARWDGEVFAFRVDAPALPASVTSAEADVLRGLLEGLRNEDIADARGTSRRTVANQVSALYRKLGVRQRCELDPALALALPRRAA